MMIAGLFAMHPEVDRNRGRRRKMKKKLPNNCPYDLLLNVNWLNGFFQSQTTSPVEFKRCYLHQATLFLDISSFGLNMRRLNNLQKSGIYKALKRAIERTNEKKDASQNIMEIR